MVWIWVWTMVWRWSDQNTFGLKSLVRDLLCLESLIKGHLGLESLIRVNFRLEILIRDSFGLESLIRSKFGSGTQPGKWHTKQTTCNKRPALFEIRKKFTITLCSHIIVANQSNSISVQTNDYVTISTPVCCPLFLGKLKSNFQEKIRIIFRNWNILCFSLVSALSNHFLISRQK